MLEIVSWSKTENCKTHFEWKGVSSLPFWANVPSFYMPIHSLEKCELYSQKKIISWNLFDLQMDTLISQNFCESKFPQLPHCACSCSCLSFHRMEIYEIFFGSDFTWNHLFMNSRSQNTDMYFDIFNSSQIEFWKVAKFLKIKIINFKNCQSFQFSKIDFT